MLEMNCDKHKESGWQPNCKDCEARLQVAQKVMDRTIGVKVPVEYGTRGYL
jgi:hypothetical protein